MIYQLNKIKKAALPVITGLVVSALFSCGGDKPAGNMAAGTPPPAQKYEVFTIAPRNATLNSDYPATLQGEQNIEIRPKVDGFVDKIYVDEGSTVKIGQPLFSIKAPQYEQDVLNAQAAIISAEADVNAAELQVSKTKPLVEKNIISHFELESAQFTLQNKRAALAQAKTTLANARTNLSYTHVNSPVNGVVGSIPYKIGSLVSSTNTQPLTTISNIGKIYAYFSLNEKQLLDFSRTVKGKTLNEKLANTPAVTLLLPDASTYPEQGRLETINGQLDTETGSASFRATFPNPVGLLRSGGSASVRIPQQINQSILIPQKSAYELQGKHFVYVVDGTGTVKSTEIQIMDLTAGQFYVVTSGLKTGDKVVYDGTISLKDAAKIEAQVVDNNKVYQGLQ